jgi:hypothetical protein
MEEEAGHVGKAAVRATTTRGWRQEVLDAMVSVATVIGAIILVVWLAVREPPRWDRSTLIGSLAVLGLVTISAARRRLGSRVRAGALLATMYLPAVGLVTSGAGVLPGPALLVAASAVLADIYFGRRVAFVLILLSGAAYLAAGVLIAEGHVVVRVGEMDPYVMRNWVRVATTTALLTGLLTAAVDYVITFVEKSFATASRALESLTEEQRARESLEDERRRAAARWQRGVEQLIALGKRGDIEAGDLPAAFRAICEAGARGLEIERCSVWLLDATGERLRCANLFERTPARHSAGEEIVAAQAPAYFAALREARALAADDA